MNEISTLPPARETVHCVTDPYLRETFLSFRHKSGLRILLVPKKLTTSYAILGVGYGSIDSEFDAGDGKGMLRVPDGVAHYLEHKMFENADGSDSFTRFSALGANANAFTSQTVTAYLFSATSHFEESLEELVRFVMSPYFTAETVEKERGIIGEEIEMYEDDPYSALHYGMLELLYREHPVKIRVAGTVPSIGEITEKDLYRCYRTFYRPDNMVLSVSGDLSMEELIAVCDRVIPETGENAPSRVMCREVAEPPEVCARAGEKIMDVATPLFKIGFKDIPVRDGRERLKRTIAARMLMEILFGVSSECYNRLYEDGSISGMSCGYEGTATFAFGSLSGESRDPQKVLREIRACVEDAKREGIPETAFSRIRKVTAAEYVKYFDSTEDIAENVMFMLLDGTDPRDYIPLLSEIDMAYMREVLGSLFSEDRIALMTVKGREEEQK